METLLHYVWKYKLYDDCSLTTTEGLKVEILDPGLHNIHAGPDFFNAKIKINDELWAGNVEIHCRSSEWFQHHHEQNKAYNSVILHVVETIDKVSVIDQNGRYIPQLILHIPQHIQQNYSYLLEREDLIPCSGQIHEIPSIYLSDWKNALLLERLERKTQAIFELLNNSSGDWNEAFYVTLSRNFGFGINNDAFERLAKSLPLKYILKHKDSSLQVESLFFGQAGLLEETAFEDTYFLSLQKEYRFLQKKYDLKMLESHLFKSLRIRPNNFPHVKIAQLAAFIRCAETLFSQLLETNDLINLNKYFLVELPEYWMTHYQFGKESVQKKKQLGISALRIIIINTISPLLVAYGKKRQQPHLIERAIQLLELLPPECNYITTFFGRTGVEIRSAADSQALIQLKTEYCDKKKCIFCRIGHKLLSKEQISG